MGDAARKTDPTEPTTPPRAAVYSLAFWRAMSTLDAFGVSAAVVARTLAIWPKLAARGALEPELEVVGDALRMAWSLDDTYLHLDVLADGVEWFWSDRKTGRHDGTRRGVHESIPDEFFARLADIESEQNE